MKNKSKVLIISTIINAIIGIEVIIVASYILLNLLLSVFEQDTFAISAIFLWLPQFGVILIVLIIAPIIFSLAMFELLTDWISFKTNKKS